MANYTAKRSVQKTLALGGQDVVTLTTKEFTHAEVVNLGTGRVFFTVGNEPAPTVGGNDCFVVGPGMTRLVPDDSPATETVVRLTSAIATDYVVTGVIMRGQ